MTTLTPPPMMPTAQERYQSIHSRAQDRAIKEHGYQNKYTMAVPLKEEAVQVIVDAHRDGFAAGVQAEHEARESIDVRLRISRELGAKAERERIIAALREPSDELRSVLMDATWSATPTETEAMARALADWLEHQPRSGA